MIVPGTTISLTLMPTYIEVRDKGVVKKKIPLKSRSFDDVALELSKYFRYLGKRLAPGVLEEILDRIGLPRARKIITEIEPEVKIEAEPEPIQLKPTIVTNGETPRTEEPPKEKGFFKRRERKKEVTTQTAKSVGVSGEGKGVISPEDFDDITEALQAVEAISDSFMAPSTKDTPKQETKPASKISIAIEGQEEITASQSTYARAIDLGFKKSPEEEEVIEIVAETIEEEVQQVSKHITPTHQIKPVVKCKALLLGETGVGKHTIIQKAGFAPIIADAKSGKASKYIFNKMIDAANHRIDLNIWSFDLAVQEKLPRKEFYSNAELLIITYAASDRWSFESIDFWLRETNISCDTTPPIIIVANKIDLRSDMGDDSGEEPVSYNEGFQYAEELAKKMSSGKKLHPVAFIETSALTGENINELFRTAAELFENNLE